LNEFNVLDTVLVQRASNQFRYLGAEVSYYVPQTLEINTRYNFDLNFEQTSKFEIGTRYSQVKDLGISFYYNYREPKIRYNSIFSVFDFSNTQEVEGGLDYKFSDVVTAYGKFGNVTYKDEDSQRLTFGLNTTYGTISYRTSFGYAGELESFSVYTARSFEEGFITPSLGLTITSYRLSENDPNNTLIAMLAGINLRPWSQLSFDVQTQFVTNKIYNNDFRILFKINHWFNTNF
jgi:opacity protein-like surface antigen